MSEGFAGPPNRGQLLPHPRCLGIPRPPRILPSQLCATPPGPAAENSRRPRISCGLERIDPFFSKELAGVSETGPDVLFGKMWIARQNLGVAPACCEQLHYKFNRDSRAAHHRLPG